MIKNIIFDIGNVLAAFDWEGNLKKFGFQMRNMKQLQMRYIEATTGMRWIAA